MNIKQNEKTIIYSTIIFSLMAHLYSWVSSSFSHDSLMLYQLDNNWQVSLGRFLHPIYLKFRGMIITPPIIAILGTFFLILAIIFLSRILKIEKKSSLILISGILSTNIVLTCLNASFIVSVDFDMLSFLFSVLAVYFCVKNEKHGVLLGSLCIMLSLGLFQAFYQVSVILFMIYILTQLLQNKKCFKLIKRSLLTLVFGGILYYIAYNIALVYYKVDLSSFYNGINGVGDFEGHSIISLFTGAYKFFFNYMQNLSIHNQSLVSIINIILAVFSLYSIGYTAYKNRISKTNIFLLIILILLMPFGINCVYFISKGLMHSLMTYSYFFFYVWAIWCFENTKLKISNYKYFKPIMISFFSFVIFGGVVYANQMYLKKTQESKATLSVMTRILDEMEHTEGYIPGKTPVLFAGGISENENVAFTRPGFSGPMDTGFWYNYAVTYEETYEYYFAMTLGYPLNHVDGEDKNHYLDTDEIQNMVAFPERGYCQMIDDILVVKLSYDIERNVIS